MEFVAAFFVTLLVLCLTAAALHFGRSPTYRPSRQEVLALLQGVLEGSTTRERWDLFIGLPMHHDPELEAIRLRCLTLQEGDDDEAAAGEGLDGYLFDRDGRERMAAILADLRQLIEREPVYRKF
ncbi:hypothetical protein GCM10011348_37530 [Marinobacterium nitratireducens]|uniref:Uncharacterized protein n=1 Tax=Marinobacterium nitratireducens TaxID=518897 RepID=A0A918DVT6_9GAMM|nr:hypothetical protein [Marinobacterium nitratireducens]GGO86521.1 hypothetical protein GCM10011348_37530 [Marinobacterium nitratireducens]